LVGGLFKLKNWREKGKEGTTDRPSLTLLVFSVKVIVFILFYDTDDVVNQHDNKKKTVEKKRKGSFLTFFVTYIFVVTCGTKKVLPIFFW